MYSKDKGKGQDNQDKEVKIKQINQKQKKSQWGEDFPTQPPT
jgi:hypothetical protein